MSTKSSSASSSASPSLFSTALSADEKVEKKRTASFWSVLFMSKRNISKIIYPIDGANKICLTSV